MHVFLPNMDMYRMVRHFAKCGLNNVQPIILERVRSSDPFIRKAREQFYINIFGTEINAQ